MDSASSRPAESAANENARTQEALRQERSSDPSPTTEGLAKKLIAATDTIETQSVTSLTIEEIDTLKVPLSASGRLPNHMETNEQVEAQETQRIASMPSQPLEGNACISPRVPSPIATAMAVFVTMPQLPVASAPPVIKMTRGKALLFIALLIVIVFHAISLGPSQFLGSQGWAYVLGDTSATSNHELLKNLVSAAHSRQGTKADTQKPLTPQQVVDLLMSRMTLDQKLGQMMIVQFTGPTYALDLSTMVDQYGVGAVLLSAANSNISDKAQLKNLIHQIQSSSAIPLAIAIDQEGGVVDRLAALDGPRPAAATIGATGDPAQAFAAGQKDASDLASYGINLNLAPVVDVTNIYNPQLDTRTFGSTPGLVTKMAGSYLRGLQSSGKVLGTLKHFPGLGDVGVDPHSGVPQLTRSRSDLESIDWAPYRDLIKQGDAHVVMVTHEVVTSVDASKPSSLSPQVVNGILRNELGFQGVIVTDALTMEGIAAYYNESQAAVLAVKAGSDLLMGPTQPSDVAQMVQGLKQAVSTGEISQQTIDDSVRRILLMKYAMGLIPLPKQ